MTDKEADRVLERLDRLVKAAERLAALVGETPGAGSEALAALRRILAEREEAIDKLAGDLRSAKTLWRDAEAALERGGHSQNCGCCPEYVQRAPRVSFADPSRQIVQTACAICHQTEKMHPYRDPRCQAQQERDEFLSKERGDLLRKIAELEARCPAPKGGV